MKKKICILLFLITLLLLGCENMKNTPTSKVESFFSKYQRLDSDVLNDLDLVIEKDNTMNEKQKQEYKTLMEKQYQNLSYKINKEDINNNTATVDTEIEVLDYESVMYKLNSNDKEEEYIDNKIKYLKDVTSKTKQKITFHLHKKDGIWIIDDLSDIDIQKIHGFY